MLWHICCNCQPRPPPQPPMHHWNVGFFKHYHSTRDSMLLIREGLDFLHPVLPSPYSLCLFALHLFEVFLRLNNTGPQWWRKCLYMRAYVQISLQVSPRFAVIISKNLRCTENMCRYMYYGMGSALCQLSAFANVNNTAQFPFLWTIQLPLSGRLMEREVRWINVIMPLACQEASPLCSRFLCSPALCSIYTLSINLCCMERAPQNPHSSPAISYPSVDRIQSDIWQAYQRFSPSHSTDSPPVETQT